MRFPIHLYVAAGVIAVTGLAFAQEPVVHLRATVTGNREQPRVMYILPWQAPREPQFGYTPGAELARDLFQPLEREEFQRELSYRESLVGSTDNLKQKK
jgi:hypothetical protein